MKTSRFLLSIALLPLGCVQGGQSAPPPAPASTATPAAPIEQAVAVAPSASPDVVPAAVPASGSKAAPKKAAPKPAAPATGSSAPATQAPAASTTSLPAPPPPVRVRLVVPAGTLLPLEIETTLSSATSKEGDPVLAVLTEDVPLGSFKLDKGAEVRGHVLIAIPARRVKGQARLAVAFDAVMENGEKLSITTEAIDNMAASTGGKDKKIIAGSAVGGLILGAIKDGKKGAAIGTVIGAAAGTGAVLITKGDEVELPRGSKVTVAVTK